MLTTKNLLLPLITLIVLLQACSKKDSTTVNTSGNATLVITPISAGSAANLTNVTVHIKSGILDAPVGLIYDSSSQCDRSGGINYVTFGNLTNSSYHLYAIGYDDSIKQTVQGDLSGTITSQGNQSLNLPMQPPGRGGVTPLVILPQRYGLGRNLTSAMVYIKYSSLIAPANGHYDDSLPCTFTNNAQVAYINNMARGDYYIKATAYDASIAKPVTGATTVEINTTDSVVLHLPVLE